MVWSDLVFYHLSWDVYKLQCVRLCVGQSICVCKSFCFCLEIFKMFFFLECAGELRINILRRKRGKEPPKQKMLQD